MESPLLTLMLVCGANVHITYSNIKNNNTVGVELSNRCQVSIGIYTRATSRFQAVLKQTVMMAHSARKLSGVFCRRVWSFASKKDVFIGVIQGAHCQVQANHITFFFFRNQLWCVFSGIRMRLHLREKVILLAHMCTNLGTEDDRLGTARYPRPG